MNRRINAAGLALVKQWEGCELVSYKDVAGIWTIGYGHTSAAGIPFVKAAMRINAQEAEDILRSDLRKFEERVNRLVKVPLNDNQYAVLVSFDFNTGKLHSSTLLKKLNAGDYDAVPIELMKWVNADGKRVKGLVNRRSAEAGLWAKGEFVSSNTMPAAPKAPEVVTKENVSWLAGIVSTLGFAFAGNGPLQWALAGIIVASFAGGAFLFIRKRLDPA
ncbi:lysozyme [Ensifer canadensis]